MVLKAYFEIHDNELTFHKAVEVAVEIEDTAKAAKEAVYGCKAACYTYTHPQAKPEEGIAEA